MGSLVLALGTAPCVQNRKLPLTWPRPVIQEAERSRCLAEQPRGVTEPWTRTPPLSRASDTRNGDYSPSKKDPRLREPEVEIGASPLSHTRRLNIHYCHYNNKTKDNYYTLRTMMAMTIIIINPHANKLSGGIIVSILQRKRTGARRGDVTSTQTHSY